MPKYVKIYRIKSNFSNADAALNEDHYFSSIYTVRNKICVYVKILALVMT
jgi:hypothetical protein